MQHKSTKELRSLELSALEAELESTCKESFELALKHKAGSLKETHQLRAARRQVARLNTFIQSKRS